MIDHPGEGVGPLVGEEVTLFLGRRRQADEVEINPRKRVFRSALGAGWQLAASTLARTKLSTGVCGQSTERTLGTAGRTHRLKRPVPRLRRIGCGGQREQQTQIKGDRAGREHGPVLRSRWDYPSHPSRCRKASQASFRESPFPALQTLALIPPTAIGSPPAYVAHSRKGACHEIRPDRVRNAGMSRRECCFKSAIAASLALPCPPCCHSELLPPWPSSTPAPIEVGHSALPQRRSEPPRYVRHEAGRPVGSTRRVQAHRHKSGRTCSCANTCPDWPPGPTAMPWCVRWPIATTTTWSPRTTC